MVCNKCKNREKVSGASCKVCGYKQRNQEKINKALECGMWTEDEIDIVLDNLLYNKIDVVNELDGILCTKTLRQIVDLISNFHIGGRTKIQVKLRCFSCKKELIRPIGHFYHERVYCSLECRDKYKTNYLSGENSPWYKRIATVCSNCEKNISIIPWEYDKCNQYGDSHHFCSQECYFQYRSKYYIGDKHPMFGTHLSDERKEEISQRSVKMISEGKMPQTMTKPHQKIYNLLIANGIECENEHALKYHSIDIYLPKYNLMIEIMGDYWHGIPLKYTYDKLNKQQLKSIKQDKSKHTYVKKYCDIEILYLWERDIKNDVDLCWLLIQNYICNNGILENYHSYNYKLTEGTLILKEELIQPYFITQNPYRLQGVDGNINSEVVSPIQFSEGDNIQSALTL